LFSFNETTNEAAALGQRRLIFLALEAGAHGNLPNKTGKRLTIALNGRQGLASGWETPKRASRPVLVLAAPSKSCEIEDEAAQWVFMQSAKAALSEGRRGKCGGAGEPKSGTVVFLAVNRRP
jgi:hypothetical protein